MTETEYRLLKLQELGTSPTHNIQPVFDVEDADTINNRRLSNYDAPEIAHTGANGNVIPNTKADQILAEYGVSLDDQYAIGEQATDRTKELLQDPAYQEFKATGQVGAYGRAIYDNEALQNTLISENLAVPTERYDEKLQTLYRNSAEKKRRLLGDESAAELDTLDKIRAFNLDSDFKNEQGFFSSVGRSVDAVQSGTVQLAGSMVDLVSDLAGTVAKETGYKKAANYLDKLGETLASSEYADTVAGYDRRESNFIKQEIGYKWEKGDYVGALKDGWMIAPETFGESLPLMAELMVGFKGKAGAVKTVGSYLKANVGLSAVIAQETNNQAEQYEETYGEKVSINKLAEMAAINTVMYSLDRLAFKEILGMKTGLSELTKALPKDAKYRLAKQVGRTIGTTAKGFGTEGAQEYIQTWGEILNVRKEAWGEVFGDEAAQKEAIVGGVLGATTGGLMGAGKATGDLGKDMIATNLSEKVKAKAGTNYNQEQKDILDAYTAQGVTELTPDIQAELDAAATIIEEPIETTTEPIMDDPVASYESEITGLEEELKGLTPETDEYINIESKINDLEVKIEDEVSDLESEVNEVIKMAKESGVSEDKAIELGKVFREQYRGIGPNKLSVEDKAAGLSIDIQQTENLQMKNKSQKKSKTYDSFDVNDETVAGITEGKFTLDKVKDLIKNVKDTKLVERLVKHFTPGEPVYNTLGKVKEQIKQTISTKEGTDALDTVIGKEADNKEEKAMRILSLALSAVRGGITSEFHVNKNAGLKPRSDENARLSDITQQLGKDYLNSYDIVYAGNEKALAAKYTEIGSNIINFATQAGMLEKGVGRVAAIGGLVDVKGKPIPASELGTYMKVGKPEIGVNKKSVPTIDTDVIKIVGNTGKLGVVKSDIAHALNVLSRLFKPTNYELPTTEVVETVPTNKPVSDEHKAIIEQYNKLTYQIKPEFLDLLHEIKDSIYGKDGVGDFDTASKSGNIKKLLDLITTHTEVNKEKENGRSLNRTDALRKILDNLNELDSKDLHYNYESAINQRIHVMQTILDYQGDKYMARQMMTGGTYTTSNDLESTLLIESVAEELGMTTEAILKPTGVLLAAVNRINKNDKLSLQDLLTISKKLKISNPFKAMNLVSAVYDINQAKDKTKITTNYMIEFDATASGVTNTLLNLSGDKDIQAVLEKMSVSGKGDLDPYNVLNEQVKDTFDYENTLEPILKALEAIGISKRDIAKSPVMTWFYGSKDINVATTMSEDVALKVLNEAIGGNTKALKLIKEITGTEYVESNIGSISDNNIIKLKDYYKENVAVPYIASLETAFPGVAGYRNTMNALFDLLEKTGTWKGTLGTAMSAMSGTVGKYKMSIQKLKRTPGEISAEGVPELILSKMFNNRTSIAVNPQHSSDAALLLRALKHVMDTTKETNGLMTVHDAYYGSPKQVLLAKAKYDTDSVDLANKYDYVTTAINEVKDALVKMEDGPLKQTIKVKLAELKLENDTLVKAKKEYTKDLEVNVLGNIPTELKIEAEPETETKEDIVPGYIGVVFNTFGKVYDYEVDNIYDYNVGDTKKTFGTTFTIKNKLEAKDYKLKEGIEYKNINLITKEDIDEIQAIDKTLDTVLLKEAVNEVAEGNGVVKLIELVQSLNVSKLLEPIKDKVINGLRNGQIEVTTGEVFGALPGEIILGRGTKDIRLYPNDTKQQKDFTTDTLVETLAHEIDHAYQWKYMEDNKNVIEVKYLTKAMHKILASDLPSDMSVEARARIKYIRDVLAKQSEADALAETTTILANEGEVAAEILAILPTKSTADKVLDMIKNLMTNINNWISNLTSKERKDILTTAKGVTSEGTLVALKELQVATENLTNTEMKTTAKESRKAAPRNVIADTYADAYLNPHKYAQGIIAKQNFYLGTLFAVLGEKTLDVIGPVLRKGHVLAKRKSDVYSRTASLLHSGFIDSEIAQKMRATIDVSRDVNKDMLNQFLSESEAINQETKTMLTEELSDLDNRVHKVYKDQKDRIRLYKIFARTGISGLQYDKELMNGILDGSISIDEALTKVSKTIDPRDMIELEDLANYYLTGKTTTGNTSLFASELFDNKHKLAIALVTLSKIDGANDMLNSMNKDLKNELFLKTTSIQALSDEINLQQPGYDGKSHTTMPKYAIDYDGHYMKDVHDEMHEYKMVTKNDLKTSKYTEDSDWKLIREPNEDGIGLVARPLLDASMTPGVGLNSNKFNNGFFLSEEDSTALNTRLKTFKNDADVKSFLNRNMIVREGNRFRLLLDEDTKVNKLGMKQSIAHSLMRTLAHNSELVQMQSVRDLVLNAGTDKLDEKGLEDLNNDIMKNRHIKRFEDKKPLPMFVTVTYEYGNFNDLPKWVRKYYKTPNNLSTYNNFNKKITLVKRSEADILLGHKNFSFFGGTEFRTVAKLESGFKQLVVAAKQKMVVANAAKLAVDMMSNLGILAAKDVSVFELRHSIPEAFNEYKDFTKVRTEMVKLEIRARMGDEQAKTKLDKMKKDLPKHKFYNAFKYGFVQSYSTSLVTKEFDTIAGLQNNIDKIITNITTDKKGRPNEIFKAIKMWQQLGESKNIGVDHLINWASEIAVVKGTDISTEMKSLAQRLKDKKDVDSVVRYVGDIIGTPASELVVFGGAIMVSADAVSKYALAKSLMQRTNPRTNKKYTMHEAHMEANATFIDYRQNVPKEVKMLSDYGILMFPSFWLRAQKVIAGLIRYHPGTALASYIAESMMGIGGINFLDTNIINKITDGQIINDPTNLIDWDIMSPWL